MSRPTCTAARAPTAAARSCCTPPRDEYVDVVKALDRRRLHDVRRPHRGRLPRLPAPAAARRASTAERFEVVVNFLDIAAGPPDPGARPGPRRRPDAADAVRHPPRHRGDGARGVRHVRHHVHRPSRPHPHPDAGGLGGPPVAQGLRGRRDPRAVQEEPSDDVDDGTRWRYEPGRTTL